MKRLYYPAERPLSGQCPACGAALTHIYVSELIDTALSWRAENVRDAPRWICRRCWGVDDREESREHSGLIEAEHTRNTA